MAEFKPQYNYKPIDLNKFLGGNDFGFPVDGKPGYNGDIFPKFVGSLSEKNFADMAKNDDIRNKNADYIIGGRLYDAVVDVNGRGDYLTIQEAIDSGKKRIFLRNGTYVIKSTINITEGDFTITGESWNAIISYGETTGNAIEIAADISNIEISNLQIYCENHRPGISLSEGASYINIYNNYLNRANITMNQASLDEFDSNYYVNISFNRIFYAGYCIVASGYSIKILNNTMSSQAVTGTIGCLYLNAVSYSLVANNDINASTPTGSNINYAIIASSLIDSSILSNVITGGNGVYILGSSANAISNNLLTAIRTNYLYLQASNYNIINSNIIAVTSSLSANNTYYGIGLRAAGYNTVTSNIIYKRSGSNALINGIAELISDNDYNIISLNNVSGSVADEIVILGANTLKSNNIEI